MKRMEAAEKRDYAQEEAFQIALELILRRSGKFEGQGVNGLHIMAVGWEEIVPRIVTECSVLPRRGFVQPASRRRWPHDKDRARPSQQGRLTLSMHTELESKCFPCEHIKTFGR